MNRNLIIDRVDGVKSVTVGISFVHGSRNETSDTRGFSHFLEHMLFKGTKTRKSIDISKSIERLGGFINGFTTHDYILIYAKVPYYAVNDAIDILIDITLNSTFTGIELEKNVVIEEINSIEDEPEELIYEKYMANIWQNSSLEYSIAGSIKSIESITKEKLDTFFEIVKKRGIIFGISGNISDLKIDERLLDITNSKISSVVNNDILSTNKIIKIFPHHSKLTHSMIGFPMSDISEKDLFKLSAINGILLDGMSSRLFQLIREKHGLVYDIYPIIDVFSNIANYGIYFSAKAKNNSKVIKLISEELDLICLNGLLLEELEFSKSYMKGNMLLGLENTNSKMFMNIKDLLYKKSVVGIESKLSMIDSLKLEDINSFFKKFINNKNNNIITLQK